MTDIKELEKSYKKVLRIAKDNYMATDEVIGYIMAQHKMIMHLNKEVTQARAEGAKMKFKRPEDIPKLKAYMAQLGYKTIDDCYPYICALHEEISDLEFQNLKAEKKGRAEDKFIIDWLATRCNAILFQIGKPWATSGCQIIHPESGENLQDALNQWKHAAKMAYNGHLKRLSSRGLCPQGKEVAEGKEKEE